MRRSASDATLAAHGGVPSDERLAEALRSVADQLAATHDALGSLVSTIATESAAIAVEQRGDASAPASDVVAAARTAAAPIATVPTADVPAGLTPHLRSTEALLAS